MENKPPKLATAVFLITIVSCTDTPNFIKYPLLLVAVISLVVGIYQYQKASKLSKPVGKAK